MAGQKRRGLLRSQARMTHVYEEVGEETLMLCLPTFTVPPNPPCYPCHGQQSSCCLGVTGCHPSTEICSCTFGREGCLFIPHHRHSGSSLVQDTGDTQSAPTVTQIPTDLHPVCSLPAHQPKPPHRLTTKGQRSNPGGQEASFTTHWKARNQTVHTLLSNSSTSRSTELWECKHPAQGTSLHPSSQEPFL